MKSTFPIKCILTVHDEVCQHYSHTRVTCTGVVVLRKLFLSFQSDFVQQTLQDMQKQQTTAAPAVSPVTSDHEYTAPNNGEMKLVPPNLKLMCDTSLASI